MVHPRSPTFPLAVLLGIVVATVLLADRCGANPPEPTATTKGTTSRVRSLSLPETPYNYRNPDLPAHFRAASRRFDNTPPNNPISDHGATLGRVLFYDVTLSANSTTSCASCHQQAQAFAEPKRVSVGFDGRSVTRNSMSLINTRFYRRGKFFWDERANSLESQVLMPIENEIEMGHDLVTLVEQLQGDPLYPPLFQAAFGSRDVTRERIALALAQFLRSIVSYRSRYDVGRAQVESVLEDFPNFSEQENYGKQQFFGRGQCSECHLADPDRPRNAASQSAFFFVDKPAANGVDVDTLQSDPGIGAISEQSSDIGLFKVPSLRNVELTAPYMHDGRLRTLFDVLEHYNWSVSPHPNLDERLGEISANGLALPEVEKSALVEFLKTLTDHELIVDPKFSNPFRASETLQTSEPSQDSSISVSDPAGNRQPGE